MITADTAKDNQKDNGKERFFVLIENHTRLRTNDNGDEFEEELFPVEEINGELILRFQYKIMPKGTKQEELTQNAINKISSDPVIKASWLNLFNPDPRNNNIQYTILQRNLANYTTKNTADYFIHKDLGRFLSGELDFFIKNEIMHLDDIQSAENFAAIEKNLRLIQTLRVIALDLITFLDQLEKFQKRLWLKKKFIVAAQYCITIDRVPESLYPLIAANQQQWDQWEKLGLLDEGRTKDRSIKYLKLNPYLMVDTALFDITFKYELLTTIENLDENLDGLLIQADNYQALNLQGYAVDQPNHYI